MLFVLVSTPYSSSQQLLSEVREQLQFLLNGSAGFHSEVNITSHSQCFSNLGVKERQSSACGLENRNGQNLDLNSGLQIGRNSKGGYARSSPLSKETENEMKQSKIGGVTHGDLSLATGIKDASRGGGIVQGNLSSSKKRTGTSPMLRV